MRMEFVSEKKVYCPKCGRSRGVVLWKETIKDSTGTILPVSIAT